MNAESGGVLLLMMMSQLCSSVEVIDSPGAGSVIRQRQGSQVTIPCSDGEVKVTKETIVVWKIGENWDEAEELAFRVFDVSQVNEPWDHRAFIHNQDNSLFLKDLTVNDTGTYFCKLFDDGQTNKLFSRKLIVQVPAMLEHYPETDQSPVNGEDVELLCNATGVPEPRIIWTRGSSKELLKKDGRLTLRNISSEDNGQYTCTASNGIGSPDKRSVSINVMYKPKFLSNRTYYRSYDDRTLKLECSAQGQPMPRINWLREQRISSRAGNKTLEAGMSVQEVKEPPDTVISILAIDRVHPRTDFGDYKCEAVNKIGTSSLFITVDGIPDAPRILSPPRSPHRSEYTLVWLPPDIPVSRYVIRRRLLHTYDLTTPHTETPSSDDYHFFSAGSESTESSDYDEEDWIEDTFNVGQNGKHSKISIILNDLTPNSKYEVEVFGSNQYGDGDPASAFVYTSNKYYDLPPPEPSMTYADSDQQEAANISPRAFIPLHTVLIAAAAAALHA